MAGDRETPLRVYHRHPDVRFVYKCLFANSWLSELHSPFSLGMYSNAKELVRDWLAGIRLRGI